jgi:hypothetical protein
MPQIAEAWEWAMRARYLVLVACGFLLTGCGHTVYLVGRTTGVTAESTFRVAHASNEVSFTLGNRTYTGHWVYMEQGGSVGIGTATAYSGGQTATATGTVIGLPTGGNGSFLGSAPDGSTLRCTFTFSEWNLKGMGVCQDNRGEIYDMQIY